MRRVVRAGGRRSPSSSRSSEMVAVGLTVNTVFGRPPNPVTRTLMCDTAILAMVCREDSQLCNYAHTDREIYKVEAVQMV